MNIRIWFLINRIGVCSIRVIPMRNRIHSIIIPYEPNNTQIFKRVKYTYVSKPTCYIEIFTIGCLVFHKLMNESSWKMPSDYCLIDIYS